MNKPLQQNVPNLPDINSRDGAREGIKILHTYLRQYVQNMDTFQSSVVDNLTPLAWTNPIAAAPAIEPVNTLQPVSGSATITTITAAAASKVFTLLAIDGFSLATGGNIAAARTVDPGRAVVLFLNIGGDSKWYPT